MTRAGEPAGAAEKDCEGIAPLPAEDRNRFL